MKLTPEQKQEIADQQAQKNTTKRVTSKELEKILYEALPVLDHGFVRVVDYMGDDSSIVQSARVSYGKGTKKVSTDEGLIKYLMRHWHSTPFEMCEIKYHVKLPIFIARQWIRHRTANVNEISGRYSVLNPEFYIPDKIYDQGKLNKQMSGNEIKCDHTKQLYTEYINNSYKQYNTYKMLIDRGVSKEMARIGLPLNMYTEFYWCIDLHNLMNFIKLRSAINAQHEIKEYSDAMKELISDLCPHTISSFNKYY